MYKELRSRISINSNAFTFLIDKKNTAIKAEKDVDDSLDGAKYVWNKKYEF